MAPMALIFCLTVVSCTTTTDGEPTPVPTSETRTADSTQPSSGNDDLPSHGAPKVQKPLEDTAAFEENPCATLTTVQTQQLNLPSDGEKEEIPYGMGCEWRNIQTHGEVKIGLLSDNDRGLSAVYAADQRGDLSYFVPLPEIEGHPAVANDVEDRRPMGRCIIDVGVTDQLLLDIVVQLSQANVGQKEPCEVAADVAGMALQTMKDGA